MRLLRSVLLCLLILPGFSGAAAETAPGPEQPSSEERAFYAASESFRGKFYERAEKECAEFIKQFPSSARVPEVLLLQAQSLIQQKKFAEAVSLLAGSGSKSGNLADQHLFWLGEALSRKGDLLAAADTFALLVREHPNSPRCLEALIAEGTARSSLLDWDRVIALYQATNSVFETAARATPTNGLVIRGFLLLGEAHYAQKQYAAAERALQPLSSLGLHPALAWQRDYLVCRIEMAQGRPAEALQITTNLLALATNAAQPSLHAETAAFQASVFERLARYDDAIASYRLNLSSPLPERQKQALLKITEMSVAQNKLKPAIDMLEAFSAQFPDAPIADLVLLTLGELRLREYFEGLPIAGGAAISTNTPALTNATGSFQTLVTRYPESSYWGKAQLNLGWCFWFADNIQDAERAFQSAVERLPHSPDLAVAWFKLGDTQFRRNNFTNALASYGTLDGKLGVLDEVKTNLLERALYQRVQAGRAANDLNAVTNALSRILVSYPSGFHTERALLIAGMELNRGGNPPAARELFVWATTNAPDSSLRAELELAIARTYEQENKWTEVVRQYESWLDRFTNHTARARAQYACARASYRAHMDTNALTGFTNFIAQFPRHELTPLARWWVADYFFNNGNPFEAEKNYQLLFRTTNWGPSRLTYQAQLMAGRSAVARQGWEDAKTYFINLYKDTNCPPDLRAKAMFCYGDYCISRDSTNKLADYDDAINAFNGVSREFPNDPLAVLAVGKVAGCYLQKAQNPEEYRLALANFQSVLTNPVADVTARSIAKVGLGTVLEKQAELPGAGNALDLRKQALNHFLDVLYCKILRSGEVADPFWTRKAGLEAAELAELLQQWDSAISVYQQLQELMPQLRPRLEKSILKAQAEKTAHARR